MQGDVMFKTAQRAFLLVLAITFGCSRTTEPGCDICSSSAIVYGTIRSPTGVALLGAVVTVEAYRDVCSGPIEDGAYRVAPISVSAPFVACIIVRVTSPGGSGLAAAADSGAVVRFTADVGGGAHDSTRVDIQLRAAP
jgi:hypothetical protein